MLAMNYFVILSVAVLHHALGLDILLLSQDNQFHETQADIFRTYHNKQDKSIRIFEVHKDFPGVDLPWRVLPLFEVLALTNDWLFVCTEETRIDLKFLNLHIAKLDGEDAVIFARGLKDEKHVITHHYAPPGLVYPDFASGVLFSPALLTLAAHLLRTKPPKSPSFIIDTSYELALFLKTIANVTSVPWLCGTEGKSSPLCVTHIAYTHPSCGQGCDLKDIYVAVKTHEKNHKTRIPIIKKLWLHQAQVLTLFSDVKDDSIPTVSTGIPNAERGHCEKTMAILKDFLVREDLPWLAVVDDDTLLNIHRLADLLACYDAQGAVCVGERYGYHTYAFPTGGCGMVFSRPCVEILVNNCSCHGFDSPDDMMIGSCLTRLRIPIIHSPLFHQARVADYSPALLANQRAISFHRFWENDPEQDYSNYLLDKPSEEHDSSDKSPPEDITDVHEDL